MNVKLNNNSYLLNITSTIVWKMLDGDRTGKEIVDSLYSEYSENNTREYLEEIYAEAIAYFVSKNMIVEN